MHDVSDMKLLRDYDRHGSEDAFAELVRRHINLVYSAALRHVGIAAHAEEITQAVFVILVRKAGSLRPDTILEGWLFETARLTSLSFLRGERRRQWREQEACMQSTLQEANEVSTWNQFAPLLDEAMSRLGKRDRIAVVLRYFKEKNLAEVAAAVKVTEDAAQSRVHRAVEKLHRYFNKRGVSLPTAIIAGANRTTTGQIRLHCQPAEWDRASIANGNKKEVQSGRQARDN
jgi:RNA polymerase sigma factor (sigma-70 family)